MIVAFDPDGRSDEAARWAARLADGALSDREAQDLQVWLEADPANAAAIEETVAAWRSVEQYATAPEIVALREAALASASRSHRRQQTRGLLRRHLPAALLAATLLLVLGGAGLWAWLTPTTYATGIGERRVVALPDGSKVSLDGATTVKVRFGRGERRLWLEAGRAKFDVSKDPLRPFSVAAGGKVVVATGTSFSVELVRSQVRVVLYEGRVALLPQGRLAGAVSTLGRDAIQQTNATLTPGRELVAAAGEGLSEAVIAPADPVRTLSWEAGRLVFDDEPLATAVERMNRYSEKPLVVADARTAGLRISGVFRAGDTVAFTQGLQVAFGVRAHETAREVALQAPTTEPSAGLPASRVTP